MSYEGYPVETQVLTSSNGAGIQLTLSQARHHCPDVIKDYLQKCGWTLLTIDPNTDEPLFYAPKKGPYCRLDPLYYRWYEALAIEHYMLMTIGGHE